MAIKANIVDSATEREAVVDYTEREVQALVVATRPLKTFENKILFFTSSTGSADLHINGSTGDSAGVNEILYAEDAGVAGGEWDTSAISGNWTFNSAAQAFTGTVSIDATATAANSTAQLDNGAEPILDLSDFATLDGAIYIVSMGGGSDAQLFGWNTGTAAIVGNAINISTYVDTGITNIWQTFSIPLGDMGLSAASVDALRIVTVGPPSPDYYLDAIEFGGIASDSVGPTEFKIEPETGTWLHVHSLQISVADTYDSTLANATMPSIPYDGFLGVGTLVNGILYRRMTGSEISFSVRIAQLLDFMQLPNTELTGFGGDDTTSWFTARITFAVPLLLKPPLDNLSLVVRDDLSGLLSMRASVMCMEEDRQFSR